MAATQGSGSEDCWWRTKLISGGNSGNNCPADTSKPYSSTGNFNTARQFTIIWNELDLRIFIFDSEFLDRQGSGEW